MISTLYKTLSRNDIGLTGGHQGGICIPREIVRKGFFPLLNPQEYNPRTIIEFHCNEQVWTFNYIYYNSKLLHVGTRNEYRLTGFASFFRCYPAIPGDIIKLVYDSALKTYSIDLLPSGDNKTMDVKNDTLVIHAGWLYE